MTTPRDREINRIPPHIGLWDDGIASLRVEEIKGTISYFNAQQLREGGEDPWSTQEESSHFVVIAKKT